MDFSNFVSELYGHGDWANSRVFELCGGLTDEQLDAEKPIGFGTLRNTLFHLLDAERLWLERWQYKPWRPLEMDAGTRTVAEIASLMKETAQERNVVIATESASGFSRIVRYKTTRGEHFDLEIGELLVHVWNHGVHHRAQALHFSKAMDRKVAGGLDYIFWKLARPSTPQPEASIQPLREYGLAVQDALGPSPEFCSYRIQRFFAYADWANNTLFQAAAKLDDAQLDRDFGMGMGSLRKNLQHIIDAERWWLANWRQDEAPFPRGEQPRSVLQMQELYTEVAESRDPFVMELDQAGADRVVRVTAGGPQCCFRVGESLLQLCGHGTHHRAQCVNMLRQLDVVVGALDYVYWALKPQASS